MSIRRCESYEYCIICCLGDDHVEYVQGKNRTFDMMNSQNSVFERKTL